MLKIALIALAFVGLAIAAKADGVGKPPAAPVTGAALSAAVDHLERVSVTGMVLKKRVSDQVMAGEKRPMVLTVETVDGAIVVVYVSPEAQAPKLRLGGRYQFTGSTLGPGALSADTPGSVRAIDTLVDREQTLRVSEGYAYTSTAFGTSRIPAPDTTNGVQPMDVVSNGSSTVAQEAP